MRFSGVHQDEIVSLLKGEPAMDRYWVAGGSLSGLDGFALKKKNGDAICTLLTKTATFLGVFDGHGPSGTEVSDYLSRHVLKRLSSTIDASGMSSDAIAQCFHEIDEELKQQDFDTYYSGSTAVVAVIHGDSLIVINLGDSRCFLGGVDAAGKTTLRELSRDHKPDVPEERIRITKAGGRIARSVLDTKEVGPFRIYFPKSDMPGLSVSRAFGDSAAQTIGLISRPDISFHNLRPEDRWLVLCSDGVTEFVRNQDVVAHVRKSEELGHKPEKIVDEILHRSHELWKTQDASGCADDCSICLTFLQPRFFTPKHKSSTESGAALFPARVQGGARSSAGLLLNVNGSPPDSFRYSDAGNFPRISDTGTLSSLSPSARDSEPRVGGSGTFYSNGSASGDLVGSVPRMSNMGSRVPPGLPSPSRSTLMRPGEPLGQQPGQPLLGRSRTSRTSSTSSHGTPFLSNSPTKQFGAAPTIVTDRGRGSDGGAAPTPVGSKLKSSSFRLAGSAAHLTIPDEVPTSTPEEQAARKALLELMAKHNISFRDPKPVDAPSSHTPPSSLNTLSPLKAVSVKHRLSAQEPVPYGTGVQDRPRSRSNSGSRSRSPAFMASQNRRATVSSVLGAQQSTSDPTPAKTTSSTISRLSLISNPGQAPRLVAAHKGDQGNALPDISRGARATLLGKAPSSRSMQLTTGAGRAPIVSSSSQKKMAMP